MVGARRLRAALARQGPRRRQAIALGATIADAQADPDAGPEKFRLATTPRGHAGESAETPRPLAREAEGSPLGAGEALPGGQEGCLSRLPRSDGAVGRLTSRLRVL